MAGGEAVALSAGGKRTSSPADVNLGHVANGGVGKKQKVMEKMPEGANKEIYASLFLKKGEEVAETYCCRSLSARGMKMGA